jgi:SAM-dependent methyltransferase
VDFLEGDATRLEGLADQAFDAVISTMALHHLPTHGHLHSCFAQIRRVLRPGGAVYLTDFGRLKSLKSVIFFAYMNRQYQPHLFSLDYERSLRAAFTCEDFSQAAKAELPADVQLTSTFKVPFLVILKTPDRGLDEPIRAAIERISSALLPRYRRDLNDMRMFFRLGGLRNDPFAARGR